MKRITLALVALGMASPAFAQSTTGVYKASPPVLTDGVQQQVLLDSAGNLKTAVSGVYSTSPSTISSGASGSVWINPQGAVQVSALDVATGGDGQSTTARISVNDLGGGVGGQLSVAGYGFNGTSWDRQRGDANGTVVQPALSSTYWYYAAATGGIVNTTTAVTVKAAAGASVRNYVCSIDISHDALGAATELVINDGAAGTVMWRGKLQTAAADSSIGAGKLVFSPCLRGTANTLVEVKTVTAVTGGVLVNLTGYTGS